MKAMSSHVEGKASSAHYPPLQLELPFKASGCLQRATVPVAHQLRLQDVVELGYTLLV